MTTQLLRQVDKADPSTLEDLLLIMAKNMEHSLIEAGATPGKDYSIHDLYTWSTPFALEVFKKSDAITYAVEF
ncbi:MULTISPECIES: hypothetical protein [Acidithiobacillus]|jgi:predicted metal-dependent enzyme (double-stranded beta helix superfamily)|uniref:Uncharacterized protein n=1 Tax=Acidithiobacillus ferrooxidans TaxID=920 RepID=A0A2W1KLZ5_ACIFR|nr:MULTISPECIES: hypothetical protein [Acidithiobacillus]EGQ62867.1 hypothetical protein GGI1_15513 [Acidithiobacillus sp. GGI-221]ACH85054.1 conserved hypothetical protein [Acidithiobacillus ferrooxidans ATCC 53993]MBN6745591.1 hypothetical protein [Acidithiobacillus sp. MC2.2]MBN6748567.1 hypothetical protein [Acidithiobacillus sp. PG05]MBU2774545.1 hypothetical protein [Acidithiobacillus ferrooxidans]